MEPLKSAWIGIDVSKDTLAVCVLKESERLSHKPFDNTPAGHLKLLRWVQSLTSAHCCHFALESTGTYGLEVATFLADHDQKVSVLNPARVKYAAVAYGTGNKTDKADAQVIAAYCRKETPALWRPATSEVRLLLGLVRRLDDLMETRTQEKNRLSAPGVLPAVRESMEKSLVFLESEIARLTSEIDKHIDSTPSLKEDRDLLKSIPGIGSITAAKILAELPDVLAFRSAQAAAAYAGLNPREYVSGSSVRRRTCLSKQGNSRLRCAMYLPAVSAIGSNAPIKALYDRLRERGLSKMAAVGAAMRKLLMQAVGVLRTRVAFDPNWHNRKTALVLTP